MKNIREYENNLRIECEAIIKIQEKLFCLSCGFEFSEEYVTYLYHHPLCRSCRNLHFTEIAENINIIENKNR